MMRFGALAACVALLQSVGGVRGEQQYKYGGVDATGCGPSSLSAHFSL
jgi:hypothetical protein